MRKSHEMIPLLFLASMLVISGCATTRARQADRSTDLSNQVTDLQTQLQAKDQQIQELQSELQSYQRAIQNTSNFSGGPRGGASSVVKVPGVSVKDVQQALVRAGFDPGPVDGRPGKKTKAAVKEFQRKNHLNPDGTVGEKTWSVLKS